MMLLQYSHKLRKVFIDINKSLLVQFKVQEFTSGLRVRALPVYSMADFVSTPVQRCALHEFNDDSLRQGEVLSWICSKIVSQFVI